MHIRFFGALLVCFLSSHTIQAQMERTMYQVFEIDSIKQVQLDLAGIYELKVWAGSSILVETNIQISHASPEILNFLIKQGRYDVVADTLSPENMRLKTKIRDRKPIKTPDGECTEIATTKLFVPDTFIWTDDKKTLQRKPQEKP
ncbi:MAG: hypothetical protein KGS48_01760 [Bacteroidetes bacterium]|nr:hypothetical protein [Bacteroidota bacterium]